MKTIQKKEFKKLRIPATWCLVVGLFLCLNLATWCQTSTVVIAEVMYDHPLYDNETTRTGHAGEFLSLYNYGEEDIDISGWRIEITDLLASPQKQYSYTIPSQTILQESSLAVIASRPSNIIFDVLAFYEAETPEEADEHVLLYTSDLAFPDTRSQIRIYDSKKTLQDELIYDGKSDAIPNEPLLRAENPVNRNRPLSNTVSILREKIIVKEGKRIISRADYFTPDPELTVQLFSYSPDSYDYEVAPSILGNKTKTENLSLSGTVKQNKDYIASTIASTQVIESGKVSFMAEEEIVLNPGFEIKDGAAFEATVERDSFHLITMLTYNLWGTHTHYEIEIHGMVIERSKAAVVAVQEVWRPYNFKKLKCITGLKGNMYATIAGLYGIGMLWNPDIVGNPIQKTYKKIKTPNDNDKKRAYMVAEFRDFCFVSTHYSTNADHRTKMTNKILNNALVKKCLNSGKPVYIAGDMNARPDENPIKLFTDNGFVVLNDESMIDLILEYNKNPYHKIMERGRHCAPFTEEIWEDQKISDHKPYRVKVKIK